MKNNKKGFTLTELIIVIVIIALLAAVLIPTYSGLVNKAKDSNDTSLVKMLNDAMMDSEYHDEYKHDTYQDVIDTLKDYGYLASNLQAKSSKNVLVWNQVTNRFYILSNEDYSIDTRDSNPNPNTVYYPENQSEKTLIDDTNKYTFWVIYNSNNNVVSIKDNIIDSKYSTYLAAKVSGDLTTSTGIDVGVNSDISSITYKQSIQEQNAIIRTNSMLTNITIDAEKDTVAHYGYAASIDVTSIKPSSLEEYGTVGRIEVKAGHVEAMDGCEVFCLMEAEADGKTVVATTVNEGANVHTNDVNIKAADGVKKDETTGVANGHVDDCGSGKHTFSQYVVDSEHVYDVCTCCGYTLVHVQDLVGNEVKTTMVDASNNVVNTPIETYNSSATNSNGQVIEDKEEPIIGEPDVTASKDPTCEHTFVATVAVEATCQNEGLKLFTCSKCGTTYTTVIAKKAHTYYDKIGQTHSSTEKCSVCDEARNANVCMIGNTYYTTLEDALRACPTNGTLTKIILVNDDAAYQTKASGEDWAAWHIYNGQNIILDLAGYSLKNLENFTSDNGTNNNNAVIEVLNGASLTVMDSSCVSSTYDGTGKIYNELAEGALTGLWPQQNWEDDVILNFGNFTLESGTISCNVKTSLGYAVDNQSNGRTTPNVFTMNGGKLTGTNSTVVRIFNNDQITDSNQNYFNNGVVTGKIWVQYDSNSCKLVINGGEFKSISAEGTASNYNVTINGGYFNGEVNVPDCSIKGGKFYSPYTYLKTVCVWTDGTLVGGGHWKDSSLNYYIDNGYQVEKADATKYSYSTSSRAYTSYVYYYMTRSDSKTYAMTAEELENCYDISGRTYWNIVLDASNYQWNELGNDIFEVVTKAN